MGGRPEPGGLPRRELVAPLAVDDGRRVQELQQQIFVCSRHDIHPPTPIRFLTIFVPVDRLARLLLVWPNHIKQVKGLGRWLRSTTGSPTSKDTGSSTARRGRSMPRRSCCCT